ncbi:MAG: arsenite methyltransferase [Candidatus Promineifilaceae bacterium]
MTTDVAQEHSDDIRVHVRQRYGNSAAATAPGQSASCCGPETADAGCCGPETDVAIDQVAVLYDQAPDAAQLPAEVTNLSLGCGDPVTLASLQPGQTVLDLGSGGGIDCFLAARRVGASGRVIGVDMTPQMLEKARANQARLGATNVEFRLGEIENLPVADGEVDIIISNCVINLSPDKPRVFREAFRALRPAGRLAVTDIVSDGPLPDRLRRDLSAWAECIGGALDVADYIQAIEQAGFVDVQVERVYFDPQLVDEAAGRLDLDPILVGQTPNLQQAIFSAKVTALKPA